MSIDNDVSIPTEVTSEDFTSVHSASFSGDEWQARVDLAAMYRLSAHFGYDDTITVPGGEVVLLDPAEIDLIPEGPHAAVFSTSSTGNPVAGSTLREGRCPERWPARGCHLPTIPTCCRAASRLLACLPLANGTSSSV